jgi:predicted O-methyltransferase YrrM
VSKFSKSFIAIGRIILNPWLLNKVLDDDKYWRKKVADEFGFPDGLPVMQAETIFGDFTETVEPFAFLDGGSLPTDLALLKKLAGKFPGCSYFEIGTWRGESVANVAAVAKECFTLNLSAEEMLALGLSQDYIDLHGFYSKGLPNVRHLEGNSFSFDFGGLNKKFDLVFIDGDHHFEMVRNDSSSVFNHLVHKDSIVAWHDYARNPETVRYEILYGILCGIPSAFHKHLFHIANTLIAVYLPGVTGGKFLKTPVQPAGHFRLDIKFKKNNSGN